MADGVALKDQRKTASAAIPLSVQSVGLFLPFGAAVGVGTDYVLQGVSLRIDLRLPLQSDDSRRRLESALERLSAPPGEMWVLAVQDYDEQDEWLLLATGSAQKEGVEPEWSYVAVEGSGGESICTYARALRGADRDPEFISRSVERLVCARAHPAAAMCRSQASH